MATRVDEAISDARAASARLGEAVRDACAEVCDGLPPVWLASVTSAGVSVTLRDRDRSIDSVALMRIDGYLWRASYNGTHAADGVYSQYETPGAALLALRAQMGDRWPWGRE